MRVLSGKEAEEAQHYIDEAVKEAVKSPCKHSKRGVVIVKTGVVIGRGYNNPPGEMQCNPEFCEPICAQYCVHAEENALLSALRMGYDPQGARMYHIKAVDGRAQDALGPSCVECSKLVLQTGVREFVLKQEQGLVCYEAAEFHRLSLECLMKVRLA